MPIQVATSADLDELLPLFAAYLRFYRAQKPAAQVRAFLAQRLARGDSVILLARAVDGRAQGFVQLYPLLDSLALRPLWLLNDLYVCASARRQGCGEALMQAARIHAEANGACALQLQTARDNHAAQALYRRQGYVRDEVFHTYWLSLPAPRQEGASGTRHSPNSN